jgi:hypothetical protein
MNKFRVDVIAKTTFPQQVIYAAMHQRIEVGIAIELVIK